MPDSVGATCHVTRDDYASMSDITTILGELTGRTFRNYPLDDFVPEVIERCHSGDILFPLLDFLVRSVDNITAMEFKRYDNSQLPASSATPRTAARPIRRCTTSCWACSDSCASTTSSTREEVATMFEGRISNAPHVPRGRAFLDSRDMVRNPVAVFEKYRARLGPTFTFHFGGVKPSVVSTDPVVVEHVLQGNRDNYEKSDIQVERMVEFQGKGLVNSHGEAWLRQRRLLAQGFKPSHLTKLLPMQQDVLQELMNDFDHDARQGPVDVHQQMVRFTLRLVGQVAVWPEHARRGARADRRHDFGDPGIHRSPDRAAVQDSVVPVQRAVRNTPAAAPGR